MALFQTADALAAGNALLPNTYVSFNVAGSVRGMPVVPCTRPAIPVPYIPPLPPITPDPAIPIGRVQILFITVAGGLVQYPPTAFGWYWPPLDVYASTIHFPLIRRPAGNYFYCGTVYPTLTGRTLDIGPALFANGGIFSGQEWTVADSYTDQNGNPTALRDCGTWFIT